MRKYLLGLIALVVAIALNAFTTKEPASNSQVDDELIWYLVSGGEINPSDPVNPEEPMDEEELRSTYSVCPGGSTACARGFFPNALPTSSSDQGEQTINKNP